MAHSSSVLQTSNNSRHRGETTALQVFVRATGAMPQEGPLTHFAGAKPGSAWYSPAQFRNTPAQISPTYSSHLANTHNQLLGLRLVSSNKQVFLERSPRERSCYTSESARLERRLTRGLTREGSRNVYLHQPCFACLTIKRLSIQKTMLVINKFPAQNGSLASSRPRVVKNRVGPTLFLTTSKNLDKGDIRAR